MILKVVTKAIISWNTWMFAIKTVAIKSFFLKAIENNKDNIDMKMALIEQNIIILVQVAIIRFVI